MQRKSLVINGIAKTMVIDPETSLGDLLRKQLLLTGTKVSCNDGHCGACSVLVDGKLTLACLTKMSKIADGASILTETRRDPALAAKMLDAYLASTAKTEEAPAFVAHIRLARLKEQVGDAAAANREQAAALALAHDYKPAQDRSRQETNR